MDRVRSAQSVSFSQLAGVASEGVIDFDDAARTEPGSAIRSGTTADVMGLAAGRFGCRAGVTTRAIARPRSVTTTSMRAPPNVATYRALLQPRITVP
jgi:hypothetical protein